VVPPCESPTLPAVGHGSGLVEKSGGFLWGSPFLYLAGLGLASKSPIERSKRLRVNAVRNYAIRSLRCITRSLTG
jgi:hypothetical protein